jgi:glycosyltransferase involved in cell wall biosynthesis
MRILFVKESQNFPRSSGHDVHGFHMMQELARLGHQIGLLTTHEVTSEAVDGLEFVLKARFEELPIAVSCPNLPGLQGRFVSYWGIDPKRCYQVAELVKQARFDAVVVVGLHVLPYLAKVKDAQRIWYAADEWLWHHWSQVRLSSRESWSEIRHGAIKGLYERAFRSTTDRVWAVSKKDQKAFRWVMGAQRVDVVPNGVDASYYCPMEVDKIEKSCVFWGRLDFGPNIDAIRWFGEEVWKLIRQKHPDAVWKVFGFSAEEPVHELKRRFGFELTVNLPDLRSEVQQCQIAVLPFVSGGGIKNKLLEAAAMGLPIIASPKAMNGINEQNCPISVRTSPKQWVETIEQFWVNAPVREGLVNQHRAWVSKNYSWASAARIVDAGLQHSAD